MLDSELERRLREIDEEIRKLEKKYGMSYKEFYNHVEGNMNVLLERFDADEVMDDLARLIELLGEKEEIMRKVGKDIDLFEELDEDWVRVFP